MKIGDRFEKEPCTKCDGGKVYDDRAINSPFLDEKGVYMICDKCHGTGQAVIDDTLHVDIKEGYYE
jgi:hypothetical protein